MLKPKQVPKEVIAAFREALKRDDTSFEADFCTALNAWPGMSVADEYDLCAIRKGWITLPQENSDD